MSSQSNSVYYCECVCLRSEMLCFASVAPNSDLETICLLGNPPEISLLLSGNPRKPSSAGGESPGNHLLLVVNSRKTPFCPQDSSRNSLLPLRFPQKTLFFRWGIPQKPPSAPQESPGNPFCPSAIPRKLASAPQDLGFPWNLPIFCQNSPETTFCQNPLINLQSNSR